jgi:hypothetical protein
MTTKTKTRGQPREPADDGFEKWMTEGRELSKGYRHLQFAIGDWWNRGEQYGESRRCKATEVFGGWPYSPDSLRNIASIASRVDVSLRSDTLSWSHHEVVASKPPAEQDKLLRQAEAERWTVQQLRDAACPPYTPEQAAYVERRREQIAAEAPAKVDAADKRRERADADQAVMAWAGHVGCEAVKDGRGTWTVRGNSSGAVKLSKVTGDAVEEWSRKLAAERKAADSAPAPKSQVEERDYIDVHVGDVGVRVALDAEEHVAEWTIEEVTVVRGALHRADQEMKRMLVALSKLGGHHRDRYQDGPVPFWWYPERTNDLVSVGAAEYEAISVRER